jgi:antitoxin ParD1/3/4
MRTNIDIDDELMVKAMKAGPFKTKKDAVEAGLKLLARQAAYREIVKWRGKLKWEGDESIDWTAAPAETPTSAPTLADAEPRPRYRAADTKAAKAAAPAAPAARKRRAGR